MTIMPNDDKLCELILYIAEQSEKDSLFGATKLNKLLFYADFVTYQITGSPITGHAYQKLEYGPAPRALLPILDGMKSRGDIATQIRNYCGRKQTRTIALRPPNCDVFSGVEVAIISSVIEKLRDHNATDISELSHQFHGWQVATQGEDIPYEVALVGTRKPTQAERKHGIALAGV